MARLSAAVASGSAVAVQTGGGLESTDTGLGLVLRPDEGLSVSASGLGTVLVGGGGLQTGASGLSVTDATEAQRGAVLQQELVLDATILVDNSGGTDGAGTIAAVGVTITDPADTPASADALRDDLVNNTIPSIEAEVANLRNAVATLAAYCTGLEDKINEMLAAEQAAGQMNTV